MNETHSFLVPDYYPLFSCKIGDCRFPCCNGWPIHFSLDDYFRLSSRECSEELRRRMDAGIKISLHPTPDAYAEITPRYDGTCPMYQEDGRCSIHVELGESALAHVCRLYPRGIRIEPAYECSCTNSCEAVLELLLTREDIIHFEYQTLSLSLPPLSKRMFTFTHMNREQEIRLWLIAHLQNRSLPFPKRLISLGLSLKALEVVLKDKDETGLDALLSGLHTATLPNHEIGDSHLVYGIDIMEKLLSQLDARSISIRAYGETAITYFLSGSSLIAQYEKAKVQFEYNFPKWELWYEQMLVNYMYFDQFPFQDRPNDAWCEYVSISAVYALLRFLCLGNLAQNSNQNDFVDLCAACFRLVEHTNFDSYCAYMLADLGCNTPQCIFDLIVL